MNKNRLTIVIPAHNESANIKLLLSDLLAQNRDIFELEKIVVISNNSTDNTIEQALSIGDPFISVIKDDAVNGKTGVLNNFFSSFKGDILVQLDADIRLSNLSILNNISNPFLLDPSIDVVFGLHKPLLPKTYIEKLAYFGFKVWEKGKAYLGSKADRYNYTGQIMAFSGRFANNFRFPDNVGTSDDLYSFYYVYSHKNKYYIAKDAVIDFKLPDSFLDYTNQMGRWIVGSGDMRKLFGQVLFDKLETMTPAIKFRSFLVEGFKSPLVALGYLILQLITHLKSRKYVNLNTWKEVRSSKILS